MPAKAGLIEIDQQSSSVGCPESLSLPAPTAQINDNKILASPSAGGLSYVTTYAAAEVSSVTQLHLSLQKTLSRALWVIVAFHLFLSIVWREPIAASGYCTAMVTFVAALSGFWRARRLPSGERAAWRWVAVGVFLWGLAHVAQTSLGASNLAVNFADFVYILSAFPVLLALSTTRETASIRTVFFLNCAQIALAGVLTYVRLHDMAMTAHATATATRQICGVACILLLMLSALRLLTWETAEEKRSIGLVAGFLCIYVPIELAMDYATAHWKLRAGSMADLMWSIPFVFGGWQALHLPIESSPEATETSGRRWRTLVETLCPTLLTIGVFALAASIVSRHAALAMAALFLLLAIQGLHAGVMRLNYATGRMQLLRHEQELRTANVTLQQLSMLDPLTRIANRRRFDEALDVAWRRTMRKKQPIALLIIDVDFFKGINDRHGHGYGDECLVTVARLVAKQAQRPDDLLARYGGDEFFLLLPDTDRNGAAVVAERIHSAIAVQADVNFARLTDTHLTVSIGVGVIEPKMGDSQAMLIDTADRALYEAKRQGRSRTHFEAV